MGSKKRPASSMENPAESTKTTKKTPDESNPPSSSEVSEKLKQMEKHKARKAADKERRRLASETKPKADSESETKQKTDSESETKGKKKSESDSNPKSESETSKVEPKAPSLNKVHTSSGQPGLHLDVFRGLSSPESLVREESAIQLVAELIDVQRAFEEEEEKGGTEENGEDAKLEAKKEDGLENCAPSLRYAIRRLVRGVSSSREFARQGFALALASVLSEIKAVKLDSLMKLIEDELEISAGLRGQEAKDNLLGRLFAYGSIARSGRISEEYKLNKDSNIIKDFVGTVTSLAGKKRYLTEPAVSIILDLSNKLPDEAILTQVVKAPRLKDWFEKAAQTGDPDALLLALKLQERISTESDSFGKLLPCPFSADKFFARDNLLHISPCFKESTFCLPRIHSIWEVVVHMLVPDSLSLEDSTNRSSKKHKKSKKSSSSEESTTNLRNFCEIVVESSLLFSSHDRKHLALNVLLTLLPKIPPSNYQIILSSKVVYCLMDILSNKSSWLHNAGLHFLNELVNFADLNFDRRIAMIVALQKHSKGKFDNITKTQAVKQLITKFVDMESCLYFVQSLVSLFVDEGPTSDEPSDQSQTTDENSDVGSLEEKDPNSNLINGNGNGNGNLDSLKNWIVDTMPRVLKNLKLNSNLKTLTDLENKKLANEKFRVQAEIMKFLAVQGLFTASLGTEVTSFELQEKFKWPKTAISNSLRAVCIENLQGLLEEAQKGVLSEVEPNDLGSYLTRFVGTVCNIPSVSLYAALSDDDDKAFKKLLAMESKLGKYSLSDDDKEKKVKVDKEERNRIHAMRYLLIQLMLQILLRPGELSEAAIDLTICCKKAFSFISETESEGEEEEDESDENEKPKFIDVLVDTFLSLLSNSSGPLNYAIEQVFRSMCEEVTEAGLIRMLRIIKKELNPRHVAAAEGESGDEDDEDDDFIAIEDDVIAEGGAGLSDESEGGPVGELDEEDVDDEEDEKEDDMDLDEVKNENNKTGGGSDDDSEGMDDDAMFRMDAYLATMFKERKISGSESAQSQLMPFKFRVLSLLEFYLHKNPGKTQVLTIYSFLVQVYVKSHANTGNEQFRQRIGGILQKKIFKTKDYPKTQDIQLSTLKTLIEKSLKLASRSKFKPVSSLSQNATFWLLKIVTSLNLPKSELESVVEVFQNILADYFNNKKSRLKLGFVKEVIRRYGWVGPPLFGFLIEKCATTKAEFRRIETLDLVEFVMKTMVPTNKGGEKEKEASSSAKLVKKNLSAICELFGELLVKLPEKQSRRADVRRFCNRALSLVSGLNLNKPFVKGLKPEVYALCEKQLGVAFDPFKSEN
ncbi:hypothetical protein LUZ60_013389 [Juncus effusus]|nr:hypothetical protein LUZ60_013389 [Juncus effusus]